MCIIIYKPRGIRLVEDTLYHSFKNNPHGAGFSIIDNGELVTQKGLFTYEEFKAAYEPYQDAQALIHFRIRTHGDYGAENTHPHHVTKNLVFAHNGVIWAAGLPQDKEKSDSVVFNDLVLKNLVRVYGKKLIADPAFKIMLADFIGGSKLVFLDNQGNIQIINESGGTWVSDCWFSNNSWKESNAPKQHKKQAQKALPYIPPTRTETERKILEGEFSKVFSGSANDIIYQGNFVRVLPSWNGLPERTIARVESVFQNGDLELRFPRQGNVIHRVPPFYVEKMQLNRVTGGS